MQEIKKAAIYIRVSTEEQAAEGQSADAQAEILTQYCRSAGIIVYKIYTDLGISGKKAGNRPGLQALLADSGKKCFDMVLVWKISRLSRSLKDLLNIIDHLEKNSVSFSSFSEKFDTSSSVGRMTLQLLGSIAEFERNTIVENVKMGLREFARKGGKTSCVLGYDNVEKKLLVNDKEAALVRHIFQLFTDQRMNLTAIAEYLNKMGYHTKRGCLYSCSSVGFILGNPVYIGYNRQQLNRSGTYCVLGSHQPIIDIETWNQAQSLQENRKAKTKVRSDSPLLSGIVYCALCGSKMNIFHTSSKGRPYRYYRCPNTCKNSACVNEYARADRLEQKAVQLLMCVLECKQVMADVLSVLNGNLYSNNAFGNELSIIRAQIERHKKNIDRYMNLYESEESIDSEIFLERLGTLHARIKELEAEKKRIENGERKYSYSHSDYSSTIEFLKNNRSQHKLRQLLDLLVKKINMNHGDAVLHTAFPIYRDI